MPGIIQVSVLGLMDLALPPPLSSLSLIVAMGKREHRTMGSGELSLPVVSLRENLIVMVHDAEGEEILRTEFRTMLLLERGIWDTNFPLKDGGSLHMKLQFLLSEEDRKRIREMRDSALKKRHLQKLETRHKRSFSDNKIEYSPTRAVTDGMILDHSETAEPIVERYLGRREKFTASRTDMGGFPRSAVIGEGDASNLNFPQTISKSFSVGMLSEISSPGKSKHVKESFLLKKETQNAIPAMHYETLGNKDLKSDEKIHKLNINREEIKEINNKSSDGSPPQSAKIGSSMIIYNGLKTTGSGKSSSLEAENSSERKDFTSVDIDKGPSIIPLIRNFEIVRQKENLNRIQKGFGGSGSNAISGTFKARPLLHRSTELRIAGAEHSTASKKHNIINKAGDGNVTSSSEGVNRKIDTVVVKENNNEEASAEHLTAGRKNNSRILSGHGDATSSKGVNRKAETVEVNENNNEEQSLGNKFLPLKNMVNESEKIKHPYQQETSVEVAKTVNDENSFQSPSNEQTASGSSYEKDKAEALTSGYNSAFSIEILDTWTPRHLCVTTGSKLLRDFVESCTVTSETDPIESSSMREGDTKQQKDGDAYVHVNESKALPSLGNSCIENSPSSSESNGGLIEQAVWIAVMIVACGLLLKGI